jgi:hypothetical protein
MGEISEASSLSTIGLMLSGPAALCGFRFCNNLSTPVFVMLISPNPRIKITNTETEHTKRKRNQTIHKIPRNLNISSKPYRENPDRHIGNI